VLAGSYFPGFYIKAQVLPSSPCWLFHPLRDKATPGHTSFAVVKWVARWLLGSCHMPLCIIPFWPHIIARWGCECGQFRQKKPVFAAIMTQTALSLTPITIFAILTADIPHVMSCISLLLASRMKPKLFSVPKGLCNSICCFLVLNSI